MFRKIEATSDIYQKTKQSFKTLYKDFENFSALETKRSKKSRTGKSGKASSYARYLIRLIIFCQEIYPDEYFTFRTYEDLSKLRSVVIHSGFNKYNNDEKHYPSATFNAFKRFIEISTDIQNEDKLELNYNSDQRTYSGSSPFIIRENTVDYATRRKPKINYSEVSFYPRNLNESLLAKQRSNWECEYNVNHVSFISKRDNNPYMESHHLIPMSYQGLFENSIDFADNIICLCPTCHRQIHFATDDVKKKMLLKFFNRRQYKYITYGIEIDIKALLKMYDI